MPSQKDTNKVTQGVGHDTVCQFFQDQVVRTPTALAIESDSASVTYGELNDRVGRLAEDLLKIGVRPGTCVALCIPRSVEMVVAVLAILKTGAGYVPLDPNYPADRLTFMLEDAHPVVLLTQQQFQSLLPNPGVPVVCLDATRGLSPTNPSPPSASATIESIAYILFTSGSTGRPKGVLMSQTPLVNLMRWQQRTLPLATGDRVLQFAPLSFDVSFQEIFTTLAEGGTLVLIQEELRRDPQGLIRYLVERNIQRLYLPFVALQQLAEVAATTGPLPTALKDIITAGEQLQISDEIRTFFQRMPQARLHNHYGPTETHVVTAYTLSGDTTGWPTLPPIGRAIDGTVVHLLDERRQPVAKGLPGEIYLSGRCVALGYLNRPDITAERFLPDEMNPGQRMYRTGDLGQVRSDGEIEFLGRADDQVKIRGHRVELGEVETVLRRCPGVKDCAVTTQPRGTDKVLVAYFIASKTPGPSAEEIRSFLLANLPEPMVPALYVAIEKLPLTPSGKLDRRALPVPSVMMPGEATARVSLANDLERTIATAWEAVLGYKGIGATDNFFAVGGTSLMVTQVQRRLQTDLGRDVPITVLFQFTTIRQLAAQLDAKPRDTVSQHAAITDRATRQREAAARQQQARSQIQTKR